MVRVTRRILLAGLVLMLALLLAPAGQASALDASLATASAFEAAGNDCHTFEVDANGDENGEEVTNTDLGQVDVEATDRGEVRLKACDACPGISPGATPPVRPECIVDLVCEIINDLTVATSCYGSPRDNLVESKVPVMVAVGSSGGTPVKWAAL